jgi:hypothetical protein
MKELPLVDVRPGDRFNVCRSLRTGYDDELRVAIYPTQREAMRVRNRLRAEEERVRAEWDGQEHEPAGIALATGVAV